MGSDLYSTRRSVVARLAFYDQRRHAYEELDFDEPLEIVSLLGNVSRRDGDVAVHAHATLARGDGTALGGHVVAGCEVFACELVVVELIGKPLERGFDEQTGLALWTTPCDDVRPARGTGEGGVGRGT